MAENPEVLLGDCRAVLPTMESGSVQCCVTSPPYWGLRDYGTAQWEGGDDGCDHVDDAYEGTRVSNSPKQLTSNGSYSLQYKSECRKCGARRIDSQLGLEATPEEYIANMIAVFREVWRVLRDDGTLWLNLGDSYATAKVGNTNGTGGNSQSFLGWTDGHVEKSIGMKFKKDIPPGLKPKDLCMMPARVAMALQADGWYLRSDIIWAKPNPMPESVTDRPTKAHEYIFLLTKAERYFYDAEAIREPSEYPEDNRKSRSNGDNKCFQSPLFARVNPGSAIYSMRNKRTVWTIATQPYAEAHFAAFPEEIPKLCILAGSRRGDVVLDPFAGSGTVGQVALELGRRAVLIELNPAYLELARDRTFVTPGFF